MNAKAVELGMLHTHFDEPTGLSSENVSTANDLLKLMLAAASNPTVSHISSMKEAAIETDKNPIKIKNTNPLTYTMDVVLSKTGYTVPAGGCLVMTINSIVGPRIFILLGSKNARTRVPDMERLVKGLDNN
jgi:D-alanyl-D-alanine endopeptidase (penicillin-binding protein 7)